MNLSVSIDKDKDLGVIFIEVDSNSNPNFIISEKKIMIAPWVIGYLLKIMLIHGIISPKVILNALDEYNQIKEEVLKNG